MPFPVKEKQTDGNSLKFFWILHFSEHKVNLQIFTLSAVSATKLYVPQFTSAIWVYFKLKNSCDYLTDSRCLLNSGKYAKIGH